MPLRDYECKTCQKVWEEFIQTKEDIPENCIYCDSSDIQSKLSTPGGYTIHGSNSASTRPRNAGSFKKEPK